MPVFIDREKIFPNGVLYVDKKHPEKSLDDLINRIRNAPAVDAVEVVRCKDCIHKKEGLYHIYCDRISTIQKIHYRQPYDFCSSGERRSNNG